MSRMNDHPDAAPEHDPGRRLPWTWIVTVLVLLLLVVALYAEEDWRGLAAWNQAQRDVAAAGESLDAKKFIPPPAPDDQNFAALPIFDPGPDPSSYSSSRAMNRAFARINVDKLPFSRDEARDPDVLPYLGDWAKDEAPDLPAIRLRLAALCAGQLSTPGVSLNATPWEMFSLLCPALGELRAENAKRPLCRFDLDYATQPVWSRPLGGITSQILMAKVLAYDEQLALIDHRPDIALDDMEVEWKIDAGLRQAPMLVAGLVTLGVQAIQIATVEQGLAQHAWTDAQLARLDDDLGRIDDLAAAQFAARSEAVVHGIPAFDYSRRHRMKFGAAFIAMSGGSQPLRDFLINTSLMLIPDGWFEQAKADSARFNLLGVVRILDPAAHRAYPENEAKAVALIEPPGASGFWHNYITRTIMMSQYMPKKFAAAQARTDMARIACRLEGYRLAHGRYPDTLAELSPAYGAELPRDVMTGSPYRYKPLPDGTYLLYSVAWNQLDDGGDSGPRGYYNAESLDWVWFNHPKAETK